jgi:hypothetical protein
MRLPQAIARYLSYRSTELSSETIETQRVWLQQLLDHVIDVDVNDITADHAGEFLLHE